MSSGGAQSGKGGDIFSGSANALTGAGNAYSAAGDAFTGVGPISAGIDGYMNPFTNDVIDNTMTDIERLTAQQQSRNAAGAVGAGAFGGDRHGIVEGLTNSEAQKNMGDIAGKLRNTGWMQAAGLAGQDINNNIASGVGLTNLGANATGLGSTAYGMGRQANMDQMAAGTTQQMLIQQIMNQAGGQFSGYTGQPQNMLQTSLAALGMNPMTNETTTTGSYTPGMLDWVGLGSQLGGAWLGRPT